MKKSILMSLKPYYYYLIGERIKKIELRKSQAKAKDWDQEVFLYMSKDEKSFAQIPKEFQEKYRKHFGKVGLKFVCDDVVDFLEYDGFYQPAGSMKKSTCLSNAEFVAYGKGKRLFGWHVSNLAFDENPKAISEFKHYCDGNCITSKRICQKVKDYVENDKKTADIWANCDCLLPLTRPPQSWCYIEVES